MKEADEPPPSPETPVGNVLHSPGLVTVIAASILPTLSTVYVAWGCTEHMPPTNERLPAVYPLPPVIAVMESMLSAVLIFFASLDGPHTALVVKMDELWRKHIHPPVVPPVNFKRPPWTNIVGLAEIVTALVNLVSD